MSEVCEGLRLCRLGPEHLAEALSALDTCARPGMQQWDADVSRYPGCMIADDLAAGRAWGLFDADGLAVYAVLSRGADEDYAVIDGFKADAHSATVHRLFTAGRAQRRGLGACMVRELTGVARGFGARRLYVDIYERAPGLRGFYAGLGFDRVAEFRRWEPDGGFTLLELAL